MKEFIRKYFVYVIIALITIGSLIFTLDFGEKSEIFVPEVISEQTVNKTFIYVDIRGSIYNPGVYKVESGTRLFQLISKAGGLTVDANELIVNQSILLIDEMSLYIPNINEEKDLEININQNNEQSSLININTATKTELETLPGIGPATAQSIIDYRENISAFATPMDIVEVPGIGEATYQDIEELITS